jgi:hypothetical protein
LRWNADTNRHGDAYSDTYAYTRDTDPNTGDADTDAGAERHADTKAAAHAVSSSDTVRGRVKRLQQLVNQELARQLASSLLLGGLPEGSIVWPRSCLLSMSRAAL